MSDLIRYYIDMLATLCGFDAPATLEIPGFTIVLLAAAVLVYACFRAILLSAWPGEHDAGHVKCRILHDEEPLDAD